MARMFDVTAAAKFRAVCARCGTRQPRATTHYTAERWMVEHESEHREADARSLGYQITATATDGATR